jgi:hypothetical protein
MIPIEQLPDSIKYMYEQMYAASLQGRISTADRINREIQQETTRWQAQQAKDHAEAQERQREETTYRRMTGQTASPVAKEIADRIHNHPINIEAARRNFDIAERMFGSATNDGSDAARKRQAYLEQQRQAIFDIEANARSGDAA